MVRGLRAKRDARAVQVEVGKGSGRCSFKPVKALIRGLPLRLPLALLSPYRVPATNLEPYQGSWPFHVVARDGGGANPDQSVVMGGRTCGEEGGFLSLPCGSHGGESFHRGITLRHMKDSISDIDGTMSRLYRKYRDSEHQLRPRVLPRQ